MKCSAVISPRANIGMGDFRFSIFDFRLGAATRRGAAAGDEDRGQFIGFDEEVSETLGRDEIGVGCQFDPECAFVRLLLTHRELVSKIRTRPRATRRAVVGRHRGRRANKLRCNYPARSRLRQSVGEFHRTQRKLLGAPLHLQLVHAGRLIENRKSKIENVLP